MMIKRKNVEHLLPLSQDSGWADHEGQNAPAARQVILLTYRESEVYSYVEPASWSE